MQINTNNYVDKAHEVIKTSKKITTNQIRNILSLASKIYLDASKKTGSLTKEELADIQLLRVKLIYDSGREQSVKDFVQKAKLLEIVKEIGDSRENLILFCRYLEALVAYHKFEGGK